VLPRFRHGVSELHVEQVVHVGTERLFDAQSHFRRQCGLAVEQIGERGPAKVRGEENPVNATLPAPFVGLSILGRRATRVV
jgi:hypothetical protein